MLKTNQKLRQQTGIVNKKELKTDFERRDAEITQLEENIRILQVKHQRLTNIIEQANDIQVRNMNNWDYKFRFYNNWNDMKPILYYKPIYFYGLNDKNIEIFKNS